MGLRSTQGNEGTSTTTENAGTAAAGATSTQTESQGGEQSQTENAGQQQAAGGEGTQVVPPAYTPNFKFKVLDKELEIDEQFRGLIKDADSEKKVREIFEKAHGLDHVKADRQTIRQELQTVKQEFGNLNESIETLSHFVRTDNLQSFFDALKIPEDKVLRYAYQRLQYREMTPEQRAQIDGQSQAQRDAYFLQKENESLLKTSAQTTEAMRRTELDTHIAQPQVASVAQAFDARVGKPGAFMEEVINRGKYHWFANQKDISVADAVAEVMNLIGGAPASAPQVPQNGLLNPSGQQAGAGQTPGQIQQQQQAKPVIPNIRGNGNSPAKKIPRSIADLRKLAAQRA